MLPSTLWPWGCWKLFALVSGEWLFSLRSLNRAVGHILVLDVMAYFPLDQQASACCKDMHAHYVAWFSRQELCRRKTQTPEWNVCGCWLYSDQAALLGCFGLQTPAGNMFEALRSSCNNLFQVDCGWSPVSCSCFGCPGWICMFSKCLGHMYIECACTEAHEFSG